MTKNKRQKEPGSLSGPGTPDTADENGARDNMDGEGADGLLNADPFEGIKNEVEGIKNEAAVDGSDDGTDAPPVRADVVEKLKSAVTDSSDQTSLVPYDPLQRYLNEISRYKLLTREEEVELGRRVQEDDDPDAAFLLAASNLRLVVKIAMEFQRTWMQNLMDLIQEGNIGLMQAVQKFDPYKNVKFSYYAAFWIKAYILKFIMDNWRLVKVGTTQGQRKLFFKLKKEKQKLVDEGFFPETKLLSDRLGVSEQEIRDMGQRLDSWDLSLDEPMKDDSETERGAFFSSDEESVESRVARKELESLIRQKVGEFKKQLNERELDIFEKRVFTETPETLQEIGDKYVISRERVRQLEKNIVKKMKAFLEKEIPDFESYYYLQDETDV